MSNLQVRGTLVPAQVAPVAAGTRELDAPVPNAAGAVLNTRPFDMLVTELRDDNAVGSMFVLNKGFTADNL